MSFKRYVLCDLAKIKYGKNQKKFFLPLVIFQFMEQVG